MNRRSRDKGGGQEARAADDQAADRCFTDRRLTDRRLTDRRFTYCRFTSENLAAAPFNFVRSSLKPAGRGLNVPGRGFYVLGCSL
jgi:hypothetical protein